MHRAYLFYSVVQLESYRNIVDDKAIKVGVLQHIMRIDGYVNPLSFISGLPYLSIRSCIDDELDIFPHLILTADDDWSPSNLVHIIVDDDDKWLDKSIPKKKTLIKRNPNLKNKSKKLGLIGILGKIYDDRANYLHGYNTCIPESCFHVKQGNRRIMRKELNQ